MPTKLTDHESVEKIVSRNDTGRKNKHAPRKNMFSSAGVERLNIPDIEYADGPFGIREEMEPHSWNSLHLSTDSATFFPDRLCPCSYMEYGNGIQIRRGNGCRS